MTTTTRSLLIRLIVALVLGSVLLLVSALFHKAVASSLGGNASFLWMTWLAAIVVTLFLTFAAPSGRVALGRLCLLNGLATALLLAFVLATQADSATFGDLLEPESLLGLTPPKGPAIGSALLSAVLGVVAVVFFAVSYILLHFRSHQRSRSTQP